MAGDIKNKPPKSFVTPDRIAEDRLSPPHQPPSGYFDANGNPIPVTALQPGMIVYDSAGFPQRVAQPAFVDPKTGITWPATVEGLEKWETEALFGIEGALGRGGGGGGGGATVIGAQAPDPYSAAKLELERYAMLVETGQISAKEAADAWQRTFDQLIAAADIEGRNAGNKLQADIASAGLTRDYAQMAQNRAEAIASAQQGIRNTATERANIFASQILPSALPVGYQLNLGMGGLVPENRVDVDAMFNQGLPSLSDAYSGLDTLFPAVGPAPQITPTTINMPDWSQLPDVPRTVLPPLPDIRPYVEKTAAGFPGWIV